MSLNFQSTGKLKPSWSRWFLVGEMGSGKTSMAATYPEPCYIVLKGENSLETLRSRKIDVPFIEIDPSNVMAGMNGVLNDLLAIQKKNPENLPGQTLVWDSLSHFSAAIVDELSRSNHGEMNQRTWGVLTNFFMHAQQVLWQLDMHIVMTALPQFKTDDKNKVIFAGPRIPGQTADNLPGTCDHHGYCEAVPGVQNKPDTYRVYFKRYKDYPARTRSSTLPREIVNFNYQEIAAHI